MKRHTRAAAVAMFTFAALSVPAFAGTAYSRTETTLVNIEQALETTVSHAGSLWVKKANAVTGSYHIEQREDGRYLVFSEDFSTKSGPDLKVVLSPTASNKVKGKTALSGSVILGQLSSNNGTQSFRIPDSTDLSRYTSVLIHCEQYTKLWAAAPLTQGELLANGNDWTRKSNSITGTWEIAKTDSGLILRVANDFRTKKAPDLKFVLSRQTESVVTSGTALNDAVVIAPLTSARGAQTYRITGITDLSGFQSLLIHCEQYTKLWGAATLN
ncbi:MAG: DM13 domain-containing protein [Phycisphaerales bacterium]